MPHIPLYVPDEVRDPNPLNAYTNTIEHIDAEVGRLMDKVRELGLSKIPTGSIQQIMDLGCRLSIMAECRPLRDEAPPSRRRSACSLCHVAPGRIPAGTECNELMGTIDLLPTIAELTKTPLPKGKKIDGLNAASLLEGVMILLVKNLFITPLAEISRASSGKWKILVKKKRKPRNAGKN